MGSLAALVAAVVIRSCVAVAVIGAIDRRRIRPAAGSNIHERLAHFFNDIYSRRNLHKNRRKKRVPGKTCRSQIW